MTIIENPISNFYNGNVKKVRNVRNMQIFDTAVLSSKGQITLPKSVRDKLKLNKGQKVVFYESYDGNIVIEPITDSKSRKDLLQAYNNIDEERENEIAELSVRLVKEVRKQIDEELVNKNKQ